jgi:uncharacterized coiled-coil protein SlyX
MGNIDDEKRRLPEKEYKELCSAAHKATNGTCVVCKTAKSEQIHHTSYSRTGIDDQVGVNVFPVCKNCHKNVCHSTKNWITVPANPTFGNKNTEEFVQLLQDNMARLITDSKELGEGKEMSSFNSNSDFEIPAHLVPSYCKNSVDKIIEKISDPKCQAVIGAHHDITSKLFLDLIKRKKAGFVVSACVYNRQIINELNEFRGICEKDLEGISGKGKEILDLKIDNFSGAIRFIYDKDIKIDPHVNTMYNKSRLNTRMTGLVDKHGEVYEWIVGGSLTLNGNNSIDHFVSVTDIDKINDCTHKWIYLWLKAGILNINNSQELIDVINSKGDETAFAQAWKKADVTGSKYMDEEVNFDDYFNASEFCKDLQSFFRSSSNRQYLYNMSKKNNIPIGVPDEYIKQFQEELTISLKLRDFFPVQSEKPKKALILHIKYREKMLFHNSLKDYFLYWLNNKCSSKRKSQVPEPTNNGANSELEAAPEPTNNGAKSKLEVTSETDHKTIEEIQQQCNENKKQNEEIQKQLNEIQKQLERLNGTQDKPTGEEIFNKKFSTNGRAKDL